MVWVLVVRGLCKGLQFSLPRSMSPCFMLRRPVGYAALGQKATSFICRALNPDILTYPEVLRPKIYRCPNHHETTYLLRASYITQSQVKSESRVCTYVLALALKDLPVLWLLHMASSFGSFRRSVVLCGVRHTLNPNKNRHKHGAQNPTP